MEEQRDIAVIGASQGGFKALCRLFGSFEAGHEGAVLVVLHMPATSPRLLSECLQRHTSLRVQYADDGQSIEPGNIYVAPPDKHLLIGSGGQLELSDGPKVHHVRPAADPLFESAAACYGRRVVGVVLTGGDGDGTHGLRAIKKAGGMSVVQHPAHAEEPQMPVSAINGDSPDDVLSLSEIGSLLNRVARRPTKACTQ